MTKYAAMLAVIISLTACSNMNDRQQKMVSGAAIGTGVGAVGAAATGGCVTCGALIGAGVGTAAGAIVK
ncbi:MAG: hypothetical protein A3J37_00405 [Alphaproteobacteria bacterium RIFCSPHIGHO2_12_FULL_45_9]|nr:MAG: hypothetical protein A3B66_02435 [Alphaproteobacteria bacterium RIFCSPHIGHO2_02_FULL_46_13]OFW99465.1 MAG: hypothetical protein A3J37_00405 [Alphaproteobacteria bacterium RIFCSPHIGHO2_12_FULL_45_9]